VLLFLFVFLVKYKRALFSENKRHHFVLDTNFFIIVRYGQQEIFYTDMHSDMENMMRLLIPRFD
jgi:hypothetical protein